MGRHQPEGKIWSRVREDNGGSGCRNRVRVSDIGEEIGEGKGEGKREERVKKEERGGEAYIQQGFNNYRTMTEEVVFTCFIATTIALLSLMSL